VAGDLVAPVVEGDLDGPFLVEAERRVGARKRPVSADEDRRALGNLDHTDIIGHRTLGLCRLCGEEHTRRQQRGGGDGEQFANLHEVLPFVTGSLPGSKIGACRQGPNGREGHAIPPCRDHRTIVTKRCRITRCLPSSTPIILNRAVAVPKSSRSVETGTWHGFRYVG
jgi:hypothetical protein